MRQLLINIYKKVAPNVFVLYTLATSITTLGSVPTHGLIHALHTWWLLKPYSTGLLQVTRLVCESNSIDSLIYDSHKVGNDIFFLIYGPQRRRTSRLSPGTAVLSSLI